MDIINAGKDANTFQELVKVFDMIGKRVGGGSGRTVFAVDSYKYAVKIANNNDGIRQNRNEYDRYSDANVMNKRLLAAIQSISEDGRILVMSYAKPLTRLSPSVKRRIEMKEDEVDRSVPLKRAIWETEFLVGSQWQFLSQWDWQEEDLETALEENGVGYGGDLIKPDSWGLINGKPVLIDYGY